MIRTLCLASGRGSNFKAAVQAVQAGRVPNCEIVGLITDRLDTGAEAFAKSQKIPTRVVDFKSFLVRENFNHAFNAAVSEFHPDLVLAVGYMRILHPEFIQRFPNRIMNIHPALLPSFPGMHAQKQAFEYGVKIAGCTVHFVDEGTDSGPVILQAAVPVSDDTTLESLSMAILKEEHRLVEEALRLFCAGRLRVEGRRVFTK